MALRYQEFASTLPDPLELKWTTHGWAVMGPIGKVALGEHKIVKIGEPFRRKGEDYVYGYIAPGTVQARRYGAIS